MAKSPQTPPRQVNAVRMRLVDERPAPSDDPLGRSVVGYIDGLTPAQLWLRGRGVWKAKLATVAECELALVVYAGIVRLVGTVDGITFHPDGRIAVEGRPLPGHPLIGRPDPLHNDSRNPIAYGTVSVPAGGDGAEQDTEETWRAAYADLLAATVSTLTAAGRLRAPAMRQVERAGTPRWETDPSRTEATDWAEFVTLALAGAAANLGGVEAALAGRSGSWEAERVRQVLHSTVGPDETDLWRHRTEPLQITLYVDELLVDLGDTVVRAYDDAFSEIYRRVDEAQSIEDAALDDTEYVWWYDRDDAGDFIARDPAAPAWSWDAWRDQPERPGPEAPRDAVGRTYLDRAEEALRSGLGFTGQPQATSAYIAKSPAAAAELWRREDEADARVQAIAELEEHLLAQQRAEWRTYGESLKTHIVTMLGTEIGDQLNVPVDVVVDVDVDTYRTGRSSEQGDTLEARLVSRAVEDTPTPADLPGTPLDRLGVATTPATEER